MRLPDSTYTYGELCASVRRSDAGLRARSANRLTMREPIGCVGAGRVLDRDHAALNQIDQMRQHRAPGGAFQVRVEPDIKPFDHRVDPSDAVAEAGEYPGLALAPVGDEGAHMRVRRGDRRPMGRPINR